ncbi:Rpr2-domain-containing protein [Basidiobolus meristosporus CBS 931.73]|uniref:Rpr2-domain-containing protein n=1 Tax=Basidiobolus meristosporus CBS 931.73 TaxID=1314790 RepID=A0A1Y1XWR8_9FUNG|nr:Rpr2-domain-containing protein [Basidiobolus meristosporus CBS 931.73]|eukprot:ORX89926.1 Rpr2-domain-containing protein [Basidiobolus meristosporus CBS 931.73]
MAKKKEKKNANSQVQHREIYHRMNFLYQASMMMAATAGSASSSDLGNLGRFYASHMREIGKRVVLRIDPKVKRTICRHCEIPLIPAITSNTTIQNSPETTVLVRCRKCQHRRKYLANPEHKLFGEIPENVLEDTSISP